MAKYTVLHSMVSLGDKVLKAGDEFDDSALKWKHEKEGDQNVDIQRLLDAEAVKKTAELTPTDKEVISASQPDIAPSDENAVPAPKK